MGLEVKKYEVELSDECKIENITFTTQPIKGMEFIKTEGYAYAVLDSNYKEIGKANDLERVSDIIGCSRKHLYNQRKENAYKVTYKGNEYILIDTRVIAEYRILNKILEQMDDANHNLDETLDIIK